MTTPYNLLATRDALRAWAGTQPEPIRNLSTVICSGLRNMAENPRLIEGGKASLAELVERLRWGKGVIAALKARQAMANPHRDL